MQKLYETYEACSAEIGHLEEGKVPLLPIYHTTQQAQIEAMIDSDGNWCRGRAQVITDKKESTTVIPCTESSSARTSGLEPHPLFDKLQYIAGDFERYATGKKSGFAAYIEALQGWCDSPFSHPGVRALYTYLHKGTLMADLIAERILWPDETDALPAKWGGKKEETPDIFRACAGAQTDAFVRFRVMPADGTTAGEDALWKDPSVWDSYIAYENGRQEKRDICYVRGEPLPVSTLSPKKIRNPGDSAKLVSANDNSGFTFRGRFREPEEAFCVSRETTEKAHSALRWLISRQGWINGEQVIVTWSAGGRRLPDPCEDVPGLLSRLRPKQAQRPATGEDFAARLRSALWSCKCDLEKGEEAVVMGMDSATPGRLSIFYYREMQAVDLLGRIQSWHETCSWRHDYGWEPDPKDPKKRNHITFEGAPSLRDIVFAAHGANVDDKLKKNLVQRLLPCVLDAARLPRDIVLSAARRASNPVGMEDWEARKTTSIACALIRKSLNDDFNRKTIKDNAYEEEWKMALDEQQNDRDYLFGRALAYAKQIELYAQNEAGEERSTNADRLQLAFSQRPAHMWKAVYDKLLPYLERLGSKAGRYQSELDRLIDRIPFEAYNDAPLSEKYLLGYQSQMNAFREERTEAIRRKKEKELAKGVQK